MFNFKLTPIWCSCSHVLSWCLSLPPTISLLKFAKIVSSYIWILYLFQSVKDDFILVFRFKFNSWQIFCLLTKCSVDGFGSLCSIFFFNIIKVFCFLLIWYSTNCWPATCLHFPHLLKMFNVQFQVANWNAAFHACSQLLSIITSFLLLGVVLFGIMESILKFPSFKFLKPNPISPTLASVRVGFCRFSCSALSSATMEGDFSIRSVSSVISLGPILPFSTRYFYYISSFLRCLVGEKKKWRFEIWSHTYQCLKFSMKILWVQVIVSKSMFQCSISLSILLICMSLIQL